MTTPKRNPDATRARILSAALREFASRGFGGARMDDIARRAKSNKRMLYHYFGDKEGLFREVLRRKMEEKVAVRATAPLPPAESLPFWFDVGSGDPEWIRLLQWEALETRGRAPVSARERRESYAGAVGVVRRQQAAGLLPDLDPELLLLASAALSTYVLAFPQVCRLVTGSEPDDPRFAARQRRFLAELGRILRPAGESRTRPPRTSRKVR